MPTPTFDTGDSLTERRRVPLAWAAVLILTAVLIMVTGRQALDQYRALRTGWSWDLAYYNQWYWTLLYGDGVLTVRPISSFATEGPEVWRTNYLAPVRWLLIPVYALAPGPETLLLVHAAVFWGVVPAAFTLARSESGSNLVGVLGAALVPLTPLLWPLAWNDFRELQLALPFVLWAVQGVRSRRVGLSAFGIGGVLACRQEMAVVVISLAIIPAREREDIGRTYRWAHALVIAGLAWGLLAYFGYLRYTFSASTVSLYVTQFSGPRASLGESLRTSAEFLVLGLGVWAVAMWGAPRVALIALPWLWSIAGGRWSLRYLQTEEWHHVRYAAPFVATALAAGLVGFGRIGARVLRGRFGRRGLVAACLAGSVVSLVSLRTVLGMVERQPHPIGPVEAEAVWASINKVGPEETVLAVYDVTAPLSSRRRLFSYVLQINRPPNYPSLDPEFTWVFFRNSDPFYNVFETQGFRPVYVGSYLTVFRRPKMGADAPSK